MKNDIQCNIHGAPKVPSDKIFKYSWQSAAAQHYFLIAHEYFYNDNMDNAMKVAICCCSFLEILNPLKVYSLIALTSYLSGYLEICSTALTKLKTLLDKNDQATISSIETMVSE